MTHFEYLVSFLSVLLGLAVAELLAGIARILRERQTMTIYWVHMTWMVLLVGICIISWWNIWTLRNTEIQTISEFVAILVPRLLYVLLAFILSPPIIHGQHFDLRDYYYSQFKVVGLLVAAAFLFTTLYRSMFGTEALYHPQSLLRSVGAGLLIALSFSKNPRIHEVVAVLLCILLCLGFMVTLR